MIQRIARLLLVTVLFANQLAVCCAHSHDGPSGSTPHIHLSSSSHGNHSHGHHHGHSHSHSHDSEHSHHAPVNDSDQSDDDAILNRDSLNDHHEDGLIYCTESNYVPQSKLDCIADLRLHTLSYESVPLTTSTPEHLENTSAEDARARYSSDISLHILSLQI